MAIRERRAAAMVAVGVGEGVESVQKGWAGSLICIYIYVAKADTV